MLYVACPTYGRTVLRIAYSVAVARFEGQYTSKCLKRNAKPYNVAVYDEYGPVRMIRSRRCKYVHRYPYGPDERHNLIDNVRHQAQVEELRAQTETWFVRYVNPAVDGVREPVTGKGQLGLAGPAGQGEANFADDWFYLRSGDKSL